MMEAFYNQEKNQYIFAANRCGTNFLNSKEVRKKGWNKIDEPVEEIKIKEEAYVIKVIRDPFERWSSWFDDFILATDHRPWNTHRANNWLVEFSNTLDDNVHTMKQSKLYNNANIQVDQALFIKMEELNIFLEISNEKHQISSHENFYKLSNKIFSIFNIKIKSLYQEDYEWMKNLTLLTF